jgi:hypothetical protein
MRVAWVHPTWRDLVIERLAGDADLRHRFLARCGPHGIALALSTSGGAEGERRLPLVCDDKDWDAIGDRVYAVLPGLEHAELVAVLGAVGRALRELASVPAGAGEARALAQTALQRTGALWEAANAPVPLDCVDAWLALSKHFDPLVWPGFLAMTWADLLPTALPDPDDLTEVQRFTDWVTLVELVGSFSPDLLGQLGYGKAQGALRRAFKDRVRHADERQTQIGVSPVPEWDVAESQARWVSDHTIRRVLADL